MQLRPVTSPPKAPVISRAWLDSIIAPKPPRIALRKSRTPPNIEDKAAEITRIQCHIFASRDIIDVVCERTGVRYSDLIGISRSQRLVKARAAAAWCMRAIMAATTPQIGRRLGGRDHTTILNLLRKIETERSLPPAVEDGSEKIANHYLEWGVWDVSKAGQSVVA